MSAQSLVGTKSISNWFNPAAFKIPGCPDFNHPNFVLPAANISSPATVGRITSSVPATFGTVAPREIDFQLRLEF